MKFLRLISNKLEILNVKYFRKQPKYVYMYKVLDINS